ncbi:hypothetical protein C2S51_027428 [Perilla frutescens var. frutescens]|nr:hypothetical protein C2S51_027428 [Perilla frutescens var. frutescens]
MSDSSCSHWWHAPFYLSMCLTLAFIAVSGLKHSHYGPQNPLPPSHALAFNASRALRLRGGFHIIATLLQISPELFFPSGPESQSESTVFAIQDSALSNLSAPPNTMRQLLRYHAVPATLRMAELLKKPPGFCLKTLADGENLTITKNEAEAGSVVINNVLVSHPDMFLEGALAVHGVAGFFDTTSSSPSCGVSNLGVDDGAVKWSKIVRSLSSNGFVCFAIGLNAVLDGIRQDYGNLGSVTVFAPPNSEFLSSPSAFLDRIVRLHILQQRFSYMELLTTATAADITNSSMNTMTTLLPAASPLQINKFSQTLAINGVEITRPDLVLSDNFIIHGISRDFHFV